MHSDVMSSSGAGGAYFWCLRHRRVESAADACPENNRLGPYATRDEAEHAMAKVAERNAEWDAEDARWSGGDE